MMVMPMYESDQPPSNENSTSAESRDQQPDRNTVPVIDRDQLRKDVADVLVSDIGIEMIEGVVLSVLQSMNVTEPEPESGRDGDEEAS